MDVDPIIHDIHAPQFLFAHARYTEKNLDSKYGWSDYGVNTAKSHTEEPRT